MAGAGGRVAQRPAQVGHSRAWVEKELAGSSRAARSRTRSMARPEHSRSRSAGRPISAGTGPLRLLAWKADDRAARGRGSRVTDERGFKGAAVHGEAMPSGGPADASSRGDSMATRAALRREQLGMTQTELAHRAGMSVAYLRQLEKFSGDFDPAALMRLAAALEMSYEELVRGRDDAPPGQPAAAAHPRLMRLSEGECWARLGTHGIGRLSLSVDTGPVVLPVNFVVDARTIVYRTDPAGAAAAPAGAQLAFETDRIDDQLRNGWSVLVVGTADHVTDPAVVRALAERPGSAPWAGGVRNLWVRIVPGRISGRTIHTA
ncbi:pyridoxamine 5'-phosphate oxidase family protein [Streptomyces sp. NPDC052396]|uniref:pyridoxamine 5'-phosphate oxidase family protein n=1 Tax=Streptomyces sp. NPDC052396 TaxID=3365689 RepID=UPI0037D96735